MIADEGTHTVFSKILAFVNDADLTPVKLLTIAVSGLAAAFVYYHRECRSDRNKMWQEIRDLQRHINRHTNPPS